MVCGLFPREESYFLRLLYFLALVDYLSPVKATITSKGQITIPLGIRSKFHLKPGDVLDFDESAPFLKATKTISPEAWDEFGKHSNDPWPELDNESVLDQFRGSVELPPDPSAR